MKLLIVIPAWNEAENIVRVVEELKKVVPQYDYVIVNDGSTDATAEICRSECYTGTVPVQQNRRLCYA